MKRKLLSDPLSIMKEHDKSKKKKKDKKDKKMDKPEVPIVKKAKTIEELRAERLKRESEERSKADRLLYGSKEPAKPAVELDDRKRKYNNQFNPEASRY